MLREPVVCGQFYPPTQTLIEKQIASFLPREKRKKIKALAVIVPHAGYIYSGEVAVSVISSIEIPENIILLGPNHTGLGPKVSIMPQGEWKTPLANTKINEALASSLIKKTKMFSQDISAHIYEHSLEVELPILQYFSKDFKIVPIILGSLEFAQIQEISDAIYKAIEENNIKDNTLILASSDMTHYEPQDEAKRKDHLAIEQILKINTKGLVDVVVKNNISMCGIYPAAVAVEISSKLGAKSAELIKYETSAKVSGDYDQVVGYAGMIIKNN